MPLAKEPSVLGIWNVQVAHLVRHNATSQKDVDSIPNEVTGFFNWPNPSIHTTRNLPGGKGQPVRKADNLTAICELSVYKMWEPGCLSTLWTSMACYRVSFTIAFTQIYDSVKWPECGGHFCLRLRLGSVSGVQTDSYAADVMVSFLGAKIRRGRRWPVAFIWFVFACVLADLIQMFLGTRVCTFHKFKKCAY
jgi:hypothetical protein